MYQIYQHQASEASEPKCLPSTGGIPVPSVTITLFTNLVDGPCKDLLCKNCSNSFGRSHQHYLDKLWLNILMTVNCVDILPSYVNDVHHAVLTHVHVFFSITAFIWHASFIYSDILPQIKIWISALQPELMFCTHRKKTRVLLSS